MVYVPTIIFTKHARQGRLAARRQGLFQQKRGAELPLSRPNREQNREVHSVYERGILHFIARLVVPRGEHAK